ncbi:hypothetical protein B5F41_03065 [Gordonibacter sp. An232A]|nr:hypothetical protein B5F41_03065 [Gordonibacter sp. An232A]
MPPAPPYGATGENARTARSAIGFATEPRCADRAVSPTTASVVFDSGKNADSATRRPRERGGNALDKARRRT